MKRTPTQKELHHLREIVGESGGKVHTFTPDYGAAQRRRVASQVREMREAAGDGKKRKPKGSAAQVEEMREAAAPAALLR